MRLENRQTGLAGVWLLVGVLAAGALLFAVYIWITLNWSYSNGERAGWVQKLSRKGYICKTWEGEMAMVSMPGSMPEKFAFTVWEEATADAINRAMGMRVSLTYEEHIGLPTTCFGDTRHFVTGVKVLEDMPGPLIVPQGAPLLPQPGQALEPLKPTEPGAAAPATQ
jgi:hypothetical protein